MSACASFACFCRELIIFHKQPRAFHKWEEYEDNAVACWSRFNYSIYKTLIFLNKGKPWQYGVSKISEFYFSFTALM